MRSLRLAAVLCGLLWSSVFSVAAPQATSGNPYLDLGVRAYESARYEEAIQHFKQALDLDPTLLNARLYLATTYAQQYIPGADSPDNNMFAEQAIDQYKAVLERDPKNANSVKAIAYLYLQMKQFDKAKEFYRKANELGPNDPEPYYSVAVIDWTQTCQAKMELRAKLDLKQLQPLIRSAECWRLRDANTGCVIFNTWLCEPESIAGTARTSVKVGTRTATSMRFVRSGDYTVSARHLPRSTTSTTRTVVDCG
jgi:hypothetical protein